MLYATFDSDTFIYFHCEKEIQTAKPVYILLLIAVTSEIEALHYICCRTYTRAQRRDVSESARKGELLKAPF